MSYIDTVIYESFLDRDELLDDNSVDLIVTSPPYFNIKDYAKDGEQSASHSDKHKDDIGGKADFDSYLLSLVCVWERCARVLKPNGKLCINTPLMPVPKKQTTTHYNRHLYDINAEIQHGIVHSVKGLWLYDTYIWNRTNATKSLMFGSYPYPSNFYSQNTSEFISVYVKDGEPEKRGKEVKEASKLTQEEWRTYTKHIWDIPIPNKSDVAYGKHAAIMPAEIAKRCIRLFSFAGDVVLDPFAGSGVTLAEAKRHGRHYIGYEIYRHYADVINQRLQFPPTLL